MSGLRRLADLEIVKMEREGKCRVAPLRISIPDVPVEAIVEWVEERKG